MLHPKLVVLLTVACFGAFGAHAESARAEDFANRLFKNLTRGVPLLPSHPLYSAIIAQVRAGNREAAASIITDPMSGEANFYNNAVASLPQAFNRDGSPMGERNELSALFLGYARDGLSISEMVSTDRVFIDPAGDAERLRLNSSDYYESIWLNKNPRNTLVASSRAGFPAVGVLTTAPWAESYFRAGTNRRNWVGILNNLYCVPQKSVQTSDIPDQYVRRDIPRAPGGDPSQFGENCKTCHAQMDAIMPAFARHDTDGAGRLNFVALRDKINETNSSTFAITSEQWFLFVTPAQQRIFGFNDVNGNSFQAYGSSDRGVRYMSGSGLQNFARVIGESDGFFRCMAKRVVSQIYLRKDFSFATFSEKEHEVLERESKTIEALAKSLKADRSLRKLFERAAIYYADLSL